MRDFVGAAHTHLYVQDLERRLEALEASLASFLPAEPMIDPYVLKAARRPLKSRTEYMRNYMAEKRRKDRERVSCEQ